MNPGFLRSWALALVALFLLAASSPAQERSVGVGDVAGEQCPTGPISFVYIANNSIFDTSDPNLEGRFGWGYRAVNAIHMRTRPWVIRQELLFGVGDCFDEFLLAESERILRSYEFLSRVDIFGVRQPDGSYHVIVDTRDEWSTRVDMRLRLEDRIEFSGVRVEDVNLLGTGQTLGVYYIERDLARDYGIHYYTPQVFRSRWDIRSNLGRTRAGTFWRQEVAYPFVGEVSHWAGRQLLLREERFFEYHVSDEPELRRARLLIPVRERAFDITVVRRLGTRGGRTLLGAALRHYALAYPNGAEFVGSGRYEERVPADSTLLALVAPQSVPLRNVRLFGILGQRHIRWVKRRGFDTVRGQQDVPLGAEGLLSVGRSIPRFEVDDDAYVTLQLFGGTSARDAVLAGQLRADARHALDGSGPGPSWQDVVGEAELFAYLPASVGPTGVLFLRGAVAGGWNTRSPFQLTLGGERGVRGYVRDRMPGGRRVVFNVENRIAFDGPLAEMFDLGATVFADAGRIWAGDVPFGQDSGWRHTAGVGLRAAFPAESRTTFRLDFAWPVGGGARLDDVRVLVSVGELLGLSSRRPDRQLARLRPHGGAGDLVDTR